jgi:hypothetical protein
VCRAAPRWRRWCASQSPRRRSARRRSAGRSRAVASARAGARRDAGRARSGLLPVTERLARHGRDGRRRRRGGCGCGRALSVPGRTRGLPTDKRGRQVAGSRARATRRCRRCRCGRRLRVPGGHARLAGGRHRARRCFGRCGTGGHGCGQRGHEVGGRGRGRLRNVTQRRRARGRAQDVPEREPAGRTDAETAEDHDREPDEEEQRRHAAYPAHAPQASSTRVLEHAARRCPRRRVRGTGDGHSARVCPSGQLPTLSPERSEY